jgi:hypothetical protein
VKSRHILFLGMLAASSFFILLAIGLTLVSVNIALVPLGVAFIITHTVIFGEAICYLQERK